MVEFKTELNPFRMILGKTKNVELMLQVTNNSDKERLISVDIFLGKELAFEKQGRTTGQTIHLGRMKKNETKTKYFSIYPRLNITEGEKEILIRGIEHYNNDYNYVIAKKTKKLYLRVE